MYRATTHAVAPTSSPAVTGSSDSSARQSLDTTTSSPSFSFSALTASGSGNESPTSVASSNNSSDNGNSNAIALGVGIGVGVPAVIVAIGAWCFPCGQKRHRRDAGSRVGDEGATEGERHGETRELRRPER